MIIIDRIEGDFLVVETEDGKLLSVPKELIPDAKEGMIFSIIHEEGKETARREAIQNLFNSLKK